MGTYQIYKRLSLLTLILVLLSVQSSKSAAFVTYPATVTTACAWRVADNPVDTSHLLGLNKLAAINDHDIWAVGGTSNSGALAEHWDGATWRTVPVAIGSPYDVFLGVSANSSGDVWTVGHSDAPPVKIAEHWDGTAWQRTSSPNPIGSPVLRQVATLDTNNAWAVGYFITNTMDYRTLIEHWDGASWQTVPSPNFDPYTPTLTWNQLYDIVAVSTNDIWAVGDYYDGFYHSLILHWDGRSWQRVPAPSAGSPPRNTNKLYAISAVSSNDIWAVGYYQDANGRLQPLTIHWDGSSWQVVPALTATPYSYELKDISARSSDDVWAVGDTNAYPSTLIMHWDGLSWQSVNPPIINPNYSPLSGVLALAEENVWAVGSYDVVTGTIPLIEHYSCTEDTPTPKATNSVAATSTQAASATQSPSVTASAVGSSTSQASVTSSPSATLAVPSTPSRVASSTPQAPATATSTSTTSPTNSLSATPSVAPPTATPCRLSFSDVPTGYLFTADILYLSCAGIVSGYPNSNGTYRFAPNQSTTRGEFAKIVKRGFGLTSYTPTVPTFSDVSANSTFYPFIEAVAHAGVVAGYANGTFQPNRSISRAEVAKMVKRAAGYGSYIPTTPTFTDVPPEYFAYAAVETLYWHGIVSGSSCGTSLCYRPNDAVTRGELSRLVRLSIQ